MYNHSWVYFIKIASDPAGILRRLQGLAPRDAPQCYASLLLSQNLFDFSTRANIKDSHVEVAPAGIYALITLVRSAFLHLIIDSVVSRGETGAYVSNPIR